ncbi:SCO2521 family protein [Nocardia wallacei]|uniref:SCO2521 family protein n=1 Tax=Nocardia wallacei TaxID=480035 RepID=UPI0024589AF2|nr:SCO2521 family protein [Nocardia wallacei]
MPEPLVVLGEIRTCLLPSAKAFTPEETGELLALLPGRTVRRRERPGALAVSPTTAVGVDCDLRLGEDVVRVVGTVAVAVALSGGRILQCSSHTRVVRAAERRRRPWSYYLDRRGVTEVIGRLSVPDRDTATTALVDGYLTGPRGNTVLDLASISERLLARLRADPRLDQKPPVQAGTTRLRWTARIGGSAGPVAAVRLDDVRTRSVRLTVRHESELEAAQRFCEDLAIHDWLLTVLADALDEADRFATHSSERTNLLTALLEHLPGLWMPGAHTPPPLRALWRDLHADPGLSRQWNLLVARLRDSIAVETLNTLRHRTFESDW